MIGLSEYYTLQNTSKVNPRTLAGGGSWLDGIKLAREQSFIFVSNPVRPLCELVPDIPIEALQLLSDMLKYDPAKRPTAAAALKHPWFSVLESESLPPRPVQKQPIGSNHSFQKLSSLETVDDNRSAFVPSKVNIGSQITSSFSGNQLNQSVSGTSLNRPEQFKYDSIPQKQYAPLNPIQKQPLALNFQKHVYSNQNQNPLDQTYSNSILSPTLKFQGVIHKSPTFDYQERVNNQSGYQERNSEYQERGINKSPTLNFQERGPTKSPTFEYTKPKLTKSKTFDAGFQFQKPRQEKLPALRQISVLDKLEILQNTGPKPGVPPKIKELSVFGKSVAGGFDRGDGHIQIGLNRYNDVIKEARRQNQHGLFGDDRRR